MRETQAHGYTEPRDAIAQDWTRWLSQLPFPVLPILLPNDPTFAIRLLREVRPSALILSGGNDLGDSAARDTTEREILTSYPLLPILGVCRGMQLLASESGWHTVPSPRPVHRATRHSLEWHTQKEIGLPTDTTILPKKVNSYHNLLLPADQAPPAWIVAARHEDGSAEMIQHRDAPRTGIMWHPERERSPTEFDRHLFNRLRQDSL